VRKRKKKEEKMKILNVYVDFSDKLEGDAPYEYRVGSNSLVQKMVDEQGPIALRGFKISGGITFENKAAELETALTKEPGSLPSLWCYNDEIIGRALSSLSLRVRNEGEEEAGAVVCVDQQGELAGRQALLLLTQGEDVRGRLS
jgi:hypothetical protein